MFTVVILPVAQKRFDRLPKQYRQRILITLRKLSTEPYLGKALKGEYKGFFSLRVWPYRILYKIIKKQLIIEIVDVGHRQGIYKP